MSVTETYRCPQCIDEETHLHRILKWIELGRVALCDYCDTTFIPHGQGEGIWLREPIIEIELESLVEIGEKALGWREDET